MARLVACAFALLVVGALADPSVTQKVYKDLPQKNGKLLLRSFKPIPPVSTR